MNMFLFSYSSKGKRFGMTVGILQGHVEMLSDVSAIACQLVSHETSHEAGSLHQSMGNFP